MTFSIAGILAVLSYAIPPFLPLIIAILAVLVLVQIFARRRAYSVSAHSCIPAAIVALALGVSAVWWLPALTHSRLVLVTSVLDWLALIAAALVIAIIAWLVLHPLSYLVRGLRQT